MVARPVRFSEEEVANRVFNPDYECLDVQEVDHTSQIYLFPFLKVISPFTLAVDAVADDLTFTATAGHGLVAGNNIFMTCCDEVMYAQVVGVAGNVISLDRHLDFSYKAATTIAFNVQENMNVDGSTTHQIFQYAIGATATKSADIVSIRFNLLDDVQMDDAKFGGLTALTKGCFMRIKHIHGGVTEYHNLFNVKSNGDFKIMIDNASYSDKAPSGQYSFFAEWKIKEATGNVIRIQPGESLEFHVQDNLTGLTSFKVWVNGHEVD
jgi:hypothetical protein